MDFDKLIVYTAVSLIVGLGGHGILMAVPISRGHIEALIFCAAWVAGWFLTLLIYVAKFHPEKDYSLGDIFGIACSFVHPIVLMFQFLFWPFALGIFGAWRFLQCAWGLCRVVGDVYAGSKIPVKVDEAINCALSVLRRLV